MAARTRRVIATVAAAALAAACTVGSEYQRPAVPVPTAWRMPADMSQSLGDIAWWEVLRDEKLQDLIRAALAANTDVRIAAARVLQAEAQVGIARAAQLPTVEATASGGRQRVASSGAAGGSTAASNAATTATLRTFNGVTVGASASYLVDFWGQYRRATERARASLLASRDAQANVAITVVASVAQAYFQLRAFDAQLEVTNRTVSALQESQRLTNVLFQGGVSSELDVRQAESSVETAQATIPVLQREIALQEDLLSVLIGQPPGDIARGAAIGDQMLPPEVPAGLPSRLLERRADVRAAEEQLAAAFAAVGVAKAQLFPNVALTASGGLQSTTLAALVTGPGAVYALVAELTAPLYEGGRLRSQVALARAQQQEAVVTYQAAVLQALREVSDGLISYQRTREELTAQQALVATEQRAVALSDLRYRAGVASFLDVLDSQRQLFSAELSVAQTQGAVFVALVQLYQALGGGWSGA